MEMHMEQTTPSKASTHPVFTESNLQQDIDTWRDEHWDEIVADIERLVSIESVEDLSAACDQAPFGPGPRAALDAALDIARHWNFSICDCGGYVGYAELEGATDTQIGIIGHVDVVPAGPGWSVNPYALTVREGYLLGRGVLDDKGPLLVALHALRFWAERLRAYKTLPPYTIRVIFGTNEESDMKDLEFYRERHADPDFLFTPDSQFPLGYGEAGICSGTLVSGSLGEGDIISIEGGQAVNAIPGSASAVVRADIAQLSPCENLSLTALEEGRVRIEAQGIAAHASTPERGVNAIALLTKYLADEGIGNAEERTFIRFLARLLENTSGDYVELAVRDEHFGALSISGGVISLQDGRICQSLDIRYPTTISAEKIERRLNKAAFEETLSASFTLEHNKDPFLMDYDSAPLQALLDSYRAVTGDDRGGTTSKGGTYARCFTRGVSFGLEKPWEENPSWLGGMHGPDEGVSIELLQEAFSIYARALGKLMQIDLP